MGAPSASSLRPPVERAPVVALALWLASTMGLWALAFAPLGSGPEGAAVPDWLAAARIACFGTLAHGLPDTGGWIILVGAPLLFLVGALVTWGSELKEASRAILASGSGRVILLMLLVTVGWQATWATVRIRKGLALRNADFAAVAGGALPADYPKGDRVAPELELVDQNGAQVSLAGMRGKTVLLTFAFAHCQTVCPTLVHQAKAALDKLAPDSVRLLIVTLDPWRDTPRSLPFLAERWKLPSNAHVLSGEVPVVTAVLDRYEIPWKRDEKNGDIAHPALTFVVDPEGRLAYTFNNASVAWLVESAVRAGGRRGPSALAARE